MSMSHEDFQNYILPGSYRGVETAVTTSKYNFLLKGAQDIKSFVGLLLCCSSE